MYEMIRTKPLPSDTANGPKTAAKRKSSASACAAAGSSHFLSPDAVTISATDGVVVVSYFLPLTVTRKSGASNQAISDGRGWEQWDVSWDTENLLSLRTRLRVTWVGTVKIQNHNGRLSRDDQESLARALRRYDCVPVFIEPEQHDKFYKTFCKGTLWPVFHHILDVYGPLPTRFWDQKTQDSVWHSYSHVNMRFRDKVVEVYNEGDLIWIHGFHLLIFRTLSVREDLLRGMLNADHIGFHLYEYARHFVTCVRRILGINHEVVGGHLAVHYNGRTVAISSIHVGVDTTYLHSVLQEPKVEGQVQELRRQYKGRKVFLGIDRLERIRGIPLKLLAFRRFLGSFPEWRDKVVLVQVGITANERAEDYIKTKAEVKHLVGHINKEHGDLPEPPVVFVEEDETRMRLAERLALFAVADVFIVTSPRDGLNRMPLEYVAVHCQRVPERPRLRPAWSEGPWEDSREDKPDEALPGVLILSEFVSCTRVLTGAMFVNPWKIESITELMERALTMSRGERLARHNRDADFVTTQTTLQWAYHILMDLKRLRKDLNRIFYAGVGLGLHYRVLGMDKGFNPLRVEEVARAYRQAQHRLVITDYGGTLVSGTEKNENVVYYAVAHKQSSRKGPNHSVLRTLRELCLDLKNTVFVVSGMEKDALDSGFAGVTNLGFGAEHGFYYKMPHVRTSAKGGERTIALAGSAGLIRNDETEGWEMMLPSFDSSWMELARAIMDVYVKRTHGTYIEEKGSALLWQYRDADPEFGYMQSKELEDHLAGVLRSSAVEILRGENNPMQGGYIEVRPEGVHKGSFMEKVLAEMQEHGKQADFLLVLGDDASDEYMFSAADEYAAKYPGQVSAFTCTVGKKPSQARSYLNDVDEVHNVLQTIARCSRTAKPNSRGFFSSLDLRELHMDPLVPASPHAPLFDGASPSPMTSMRKNFSLGDMEGSGSRERQPATSGPVASPQASAITWATYVETIKEGNEDDGIFF